MVNIPTKINNEQCGFDFVSKLQLKDAIIQHHFHLNIDYWKFILSILTGVVMVNLETTCKSESQYKIQYSLKGLFPQLKFD